MRSKKATTVQIRRAATVLAEELRSVTTGKLTPLKRARLKSIALAAAVTADLAA